MSVSLQALREAQGLSRAALAERADITDRTVRNLEQGVYKPSLDTARKLAAALNVPLDDLLADPRK